MPTTKFETFSITVGTVRIISDSNLLFDYLPYILGAIVSVTVFIGLVLRDRRTVNSINKKLYNLKKRGK